MPAVAGADPVLDVPPPPASYGGAAAAPAADAAPRPQPPAPAAPAAPETAKTANRIELLTFQAVHGAFIGAEVCAIVECDLFEQLPGAMLLGAGVGFALTFALTQDGVRPGAVAAVETGVVFGVMHAGALIGMVESISGSSTNAGVLLAGQLGGLALGGSLYAILRPTEGRVVAGRATGLWAAALTGLTLAATTDSVRSETVFGVLLAAADVGLLLGGTLLYELARPSRARTLLTSLLGLAGVGVGALLGVTFSAGTPNFRHIVPATAAICGTAGLAIGAWVTQGWRERTLDDVPEVALVPAPGGAMVHVAMALP